MAEQATPVDVGNHKVLTIDDWPIEEDAKKILAGFEKSRVKNKAQNHIKFDKLVSTLQLNARIPDLSVRFLKQTTTFNKLKSLLLPRDVKSAEMNMCSEEPRYVDWIKTMCDPNGDARQQAIYELRLSYSENLRDLWEENLTLLKHIEDAKTADLTMIVPTFFRLLEQKFAMLPQYRARHIERMLTDGFYNGIVPNENNEIPVINVYNKLFPQDHIARADCVTWLFKELEVVRYTPGETMDFPYRDAGPNWTEYRNDKLILPADFTQISLDTAVKAGNEKLDKVIRQEDNVVEAMELMRNHFELEHGRAQMRSLFAATTDPSGPSEDATLAAKIERTDNVAKPWVQKGDTFENGELLMQDGAKRVCPNCPPGRNNHAGKDFQCPAASAPAKRKGETQPHANKGKKGTGANHNANCRFGEKCSRVKSAKGCPFNHPERSKSSKGGGKAAKQKSLTEEKAFSVHDIQSMIQQSVTAALAAIKKEEMCPCTSWGNTGLAHPKANCVHFGKFTSSIENHVKTIQQNPLQPNEATNE